MLIQYVTLFIFNLMLAFNLKYQNVWMHWEYELNWTSPRKRA